MIADFCVFLDAGHGGLDLEGKYVSAPGKQFKHSRGTFHGDGWFYEGVFNRTIVSLVASKLRNLGFQVLILSHDYLDTPLSTRTDKANWYYENFSRGILLSSHGNASPSHRGRGFEVYTSRGETKADRIAELHWKNVETLLGDRIVMRMDQKDNDLDKEANFWILRRTKMPAILIEHLFFDNYEDALLLMDDEIVELFAEAQVRTVIEYFNSL
ncbi:MAG: hypothetical protein Sapg2KO_09700 [Saprospiraceae bacterium]